MGMRAALIIAILLGSLNISLAIRSLSSLHVEMRTTVRIADGAEGHGAP